MKASKEDNSYDSKRRRIDAFFIQVEKSPTFLV